MVEIKFPDPARSLIGEATDERDARLAHAQAALCKALNAAVDHLDVGTVLREVQKIAASHLGDDMARALWGEVGSENKGKAGRPHGSSNLQRDLELLDIYDHWAKHNPSETMASRCTRISQLAHKEYPGRYGHGDSPRAIEKVLKNLVKAREAAQEMRNKEHEGLMRLRWGPAWDGGSTTLLG
jgi:hypothetical protein